MFASFEWMAQETGWHKKRFDSGLVDQTYDRTEKMKVEFDEVEKLTTVINKREALLGITKTHFSELKQIQDDLKPLFELWAVASRFNNTMPIWLEGQFEGLDSAEIDNTVEEWLIELKRLQKTNVVLNHKRQAELL